MATDQMNSARELSAGLTREAVLRHLRIAVMARETDEVEKTWQKIGRAKFCILGSGQEVAQIAAARPLRDGDWIRSYYRGITESLLAGTVTVRQALAQVLGDTEPGHDPASGGRMMGRHFGSRIVGDDGELIDLRQQINHASDVSPTASQMGPALGLALASKVFKAEPKILERHPGLSRGGQEVILVSIGDASMAEGIALEMVNQAVVQKAPLVLSVYDNGYGISVPAERQIAHASISRALSGFAPREAGEDGLKIFGPLGDWQYPELLAAYDEAYAWVRETGNPALVHVQVTQLEGHSSSGDHRRYKTPERLKWELEHDGILHLKRFIIDSGFADEAEVEALIKEARAEVRSEAEAAWRDYYQPIADRALEVHALYQKAKGQVDGLPDQAAAELAADARPESRNFLTRGRILTVARRLTAALRRAGAPLVDEGRALCRSIEERARARFSDEVYAPKARSARAAPELPPRFAGDASTDTGAHIIAAGFATMMAEDPRVVIYGEDAGRLGGVTTCTLGLQSGKAQVEPSIWKRSPALQRYTPEAGFGEGRVWDTAIAEGTIVGAAAGLAIRGLRPVGEIQYHDYVNYGAQQLEDEIACLRHRTRGGQEAPCLIRCHGHRLLGMWHAGSPMAMMLRMPGLMVLTPRNALQAVALYRAVLKHGRDPAFSVEPLLDLYGKLKVPENLDEVCLPVGHSERLRAGEDLTIITYGHCCTLALKAAEELERDMGLSVEVVDLQTLNPLDLNDVAGASIRKTGRVLLLDEDYANGAMGMIAKSLIFDRRDPEGRPMTWYIEAVKVLTAPEHKPAYGADGGFFSKPQIHHIVDEACALFDELDGGDRRLY